MHVAVDHAIAYGDGQVHTNGLENFWSLLKRAIEGTYVNVDGVLRSVIGKRLTCAELISAEMQYARR